MSIAHHRWDLDSTKRLAAIDSPDGNGRTERTCEKCGMVKITVHPPHGRPWRNSNGYSWPGKATPPCLAQSEASPTLASESTAEVIAR